MKKIIEGCGGLFKSKAGNVLTCGEQRDDGCNFKCKRCLEEYKDGTLSTENISNAEKIKEKIRLSRKGDLKIEEKIKELKQQLFYSMNYRVGLASALPESERD